jgi:hypothetical protein
VVKTARTHCFKVTRNYYSLKVPILSKLMDTKKWKNNAILGRKLTSGTVGMNALYGRGRWNVDTQTMRHGGQYHGRKVSDA